MSSKVAILAVYLLSYITNAQLSEFRLPTTVLPINYNLELYPDIEANTFEGTELINIDITEEYFDNVNPTDNFNVAFNYYPGPEPETDRYMVINAASFHINVSTDNVIYDLIEDGLALDDDTQIAIATFDISIQEVEDLVFQWDIENISVNTFTLFMQYTARIRGGSDLAGWYRSNYEDADENLVRNLVTQFQATDARSAFPCFDEPAFKATFDITFIAPNDSVTLSNTEILNETETEGECVAITEGDTNTACKRVTFRTTPKMSTYLLAFVIGKYEVEENPDDNDGVAQRVFYPPTISQTRAQFALQESIDVLNEFGKADVFGIPYEISGLTKLDSIGVSDFAAGAMENWGMVIYRAVRLLVDPDESSQASKSGQILIIAHELAHQWFGNLVSPAWWDDLWLNEGFATFMAYYCANREEIQPDYQTNQLKLQAISNVMIDDSSVYTESVRKDIDGDPTQILSSFSSITYQKGMGVINTMANVMGIEPFLRGIEDYLREYQFDTADSDELGAILDETMEEISDVMNSHIRQEGLPLLRVFVEEDGDNYKFTVEQERFVKIPDFYDSDADLPPFVTQEMVDAFDNQTWLLPFQPRNDAGTAVLEGGLEILSDKQPFEFTPTLTPRYVLANPIDGGEEEENALFNYFRVFYDDMSLKMIVDNFETVGEQDRYLIIADRYALMLGSYITPESYLDFVQDVVDKMLSGQEKGTFFPDYPTYNLIIDSFIYMDDVYCELVFEGNSYTEEEQSVRQYLRELARDILRRVLDYVVADIDDPFSIVDVDEDEFICPDDEDCNILQGALLQALVRFNDQPIINEAHAIYYACNNSVCTDQENCAGDCVPRVNEDEERYEIVREDVLQAFFAAVMSYDKSKDDDFQSIIDLYDKVNIEQQTYILNALGAVYPDGRNDPADVVQQALEFINSSAVRTNNKINAYVAMKQCTAREKLWEFMTEGDYPNTIFDQLFEGGGLFSQDPLTALANAFSSQDRYDEVEAFFNDADRTNAGTVRVKNQTLENIYVRSAWKESTQSSMGVYLRTYVVDKYESDLEIWEIILITIVCCAGLILMVIAFWGVSKPTDSDRIVYYMSMKREKRMRRKSSQGAPAALTSSLGHSLDRSLRTNSQAQNTTGDIDLAEATPGTNGNNNIEEEQQQENGGIMGGSGYGATKPFNYSSLKEDDEQTS